MSAELKSPPDYSIYVVAILGPAPVKTPYKVPFGNVGKTCVVGFSEGMLGQGCS